MIRSMTGFGQGEGQAVGLTFRVEIRSVNSRFREVKVKMPRALFALEERIKGLVAQQVSRGRIEVWVRIEGEAPWSRIQVNRQLAQDYLAALGELKESLDLEGRPDLSLMAGLGDIFVLAEERPETEAVWPGLNQAVNQALDGLVAMRQAEGERLAADIATRLESVAAAVERVSEDAPQLRDAAVERIKERVANLIEQEVDPQRLAQEAAFLTDKSDVTEEIVRLRSHLEQVKAFLTDGGIVGRKLDFLIQEVYRELNTIGSKAGDPEISREIIEAKAEQEKIREQVQNLE